MAEIERTAQSSMARGATHLRRANSQSWHMRVFVDTNVLARPEVAARARALARDLTLNLAEPLKIGGIQRQQLRDSVTLHDGH